MARANSKRVSNYSGQKKVEKVHKNGLLIKYQFQGLIMAILIKTLDDERRFFLPSVSIQMVDML